MLATILFASTALGAGFALHTPLWQSPDEPAHYNYVAQLADGLPGHPQIAEGDYPFERLERLKSEGFVEGSDIGGIEYEDHQPPAYYAIASIAFRFGGTDEAGRALLIRLSGVLLGLVTITFAWAIFRAAWPGQDHALALAVAAGVAFLPMHAAIVAAINNDVLADVAMAAVLFVAVRRATGRLTGRRFTMIGGSALGLALLTKLTVYPAASLIVLAEFMRWMRDGRMRTAQSIRHASGALLLGGAVAIPWFARNAAVYGLTDPFGLKAHDLVVTGQPTTAEWIAREGLWATLSRGFIWTFESFWGVFGWMGLFLDQRIYAVLGLFSACVALGFVGYACGEIKNDDDRRRVMTIFGMAILTSVSGYLWYNLHFVQHQGRYLFPALIPLAAFGALGVGWVLDGGARLMGASRPARVRIVRAGLLGISLSMLALAVLALTRYVIPLL